MNEKRRLVIEKLLEKIHSGEIVVGDKLLPERQLAEAVGETRPVMREGLIALDAMGVIDIRDRQGIFLSSNEENEARMMLHRVRGWPADILSRVMEVRQIIEPLATGLAAARRGEKDLIKIQECLKHMEELAGQAGEEAAKEGAYWNTSFHTVIVESADNAYLSRIYEGVYSIIEQGHVDDEDQYLSRGTWRPVGRLSGPCPALRADRGKRFRRGRALCGRASAAHYSRHGPAWTDRTDVGPL